jgi:hypothetical protein
MKNVKLVFCGDFDSEETNKEMQVYVNQNDKLYLCIDDSEDSFRWQYIVLNKETAIKFSRELRKQIALMP